MWKVEECMRKVEVHFRGAEQFNTNSWFAYDVISCHLAPSWLTLQITSAVYSEVLASIYYLIVSFSVL